MRKTKIFITIFTLYEFVMLTILQISDYCVFWFNKNFCATNNFKYFLLCIMLPILVMLVLWWMPEIAQPFCKNKCQCDTHQSEPQRNKDQEIISKQDIEKFITTAIVVGIQKFAATHPRTKEIFDNVTDVIKGAETKKKKAK